MALWEFLWSWSWTTKWLYHLNWNANDSSWNWNNWTATNVSWVGGRLWSGSASFNGSNSIIRIPDSNTLEWFSQLTISCWIKPNNNTITQALIVKSNNAEWVPSTDPFQLWGLFIASAWVFFPISTWVAWSRKTLYTGTYTTWEWNYITATYDWVTMKIYINWVVEPVTTSTTITIWSNAENVRIWALNQFASLQFYDWLIDEVIVENRAWTANEIKKHYTYQKGLFWII